MTWTCRLMEDCTWNFNRQRSSWTWAFSDEDGFVSRITAITIMMERTLSKKTAFQPLIQTLARNVHVDAVERHWNESSATREFMDVFGEKVTDEDGLLSRSMIIKQRTPSWRNESGSIVWPARVCFSLSSRLRRICVRSSSWFRWETARVLMLTAFFLFLQWQLSS